MLFNISELDPRGVGLDCTVEIPPFEWEAGDTVSCEPAHLVGTMKPTRRGIELVGQYATIAHLHCARCLAAFDMPLDEKFRLFLQPLPEEGAEEPGIEEVPEDDPDAIDLYPVNGQVVDLSAVLQEQVDLALPLFAICREDCRGLCTGCGADLNREACRCAPVRDDRFGALEQLKQVLEQKKNQGRT